MYIKVGNDGVPIPYSLTELKRNNPNVSFADKITDQTLADYNVYRVEPDPKPVDDVVLFGDYYQDGDQWKHSWTHRSYTPDEYRPKMVVTMRQARLALLQQGLLAGVEAAINLMPEPDRSKVSIEWEYASTVERMSPWMSAMGAALGLTEEQLDDLFILAASI